MHSNGPTRGEFLRQLGLGALARFSLRAAARPNVLVIVTDDQGYADLSAYRHAAKDVAPRTLNRRFSIWQMTPPNSSTSQRTTL